MNYFNSYYFSNPSYSKKFSDLQKVLQQDFYTYKHSLNVASYSVELAKLSEQDLDLDVVYYSGLFHDIGKVEINSKILNKVEPLTENEFSLIKTHVSLGHSILSQNNLPDELLLAAQSHHERYDGKGYPSGLSGDSIPLIAKVISICDVFDALTMDRPYRKAYTFEKAIEIISNSAGQFDPGLLKLFLNARKRENAAKTAVPGYFPRKLL